MARVCLASRSRWYGIAAHRITLEVWMSWAQRCVSQVTRTLSAALSREVVSIPSTRPLASQYFRIGGQCCPKPPG
jgi:hypothetical protein